ncbi:MAG: radical SAM protein [Acidimicrobiia bacterium]|jgi:radical SAM superfamily enzyme YgiQ (UPF0313 family)|nr:MAG: radical SAM protein [Acidimicrobiia bacterium]
MEPMRALLVSTYEMGHQPLGVASAAAALTEAGHDVRALDLQVEPYREDLVDWADAVAVSVPMHTAMRLAVPLAEKIRERRPDLPIAFYGLYAAVARDRTVARLIDKAIVGEYLPGLVSWFADLDRGVEVDLTVQQFGVPRRDLLPPLDRYSHLQIGDEHRLAGYVEASHGCRHRCRHCPVPAVYDGLFRIVGVEPVVSDVAQLVDMGARHISFGDPDFLNAPVYAAKVIDAVHRTFPDLTFDVTVKVEHLLAHPGLLETLAASNVLFVVSAFETVSDHILRLLDKGHTVADMARAVEECRRVGIDIRASWLPFTPWTRPDDLLGVFRFLADHDLAATTDPVQLSIRLLVPDGSLLLDLPDMVPYLGDYDPVGLTYRWEYAHPELDRVQATLAELAAEAADRGEDPGTTLTEMWARSAELLDLPASEVIPAGATSGRPRMTEPWFC